MDINCDKIVEKYLLIQNPLYTFSFPLSVLIAIIVFGLGKAYNWSDNSYINQILIPILALLLTMVIIDMVSRLMINQEQKIKLTQLCKIWMHDPNVKRNPRLNKKIDMEEIARYRVENFTDFSQHDLTAPLLTNNNMSRDSMKGNKINNNNKDNVESLLAEIPDMNPFPLESKPNGHQCIQNSNGCNLCSGSNQNPDNLIAPIPGPQWMPQSAEYVQNRLVNNNYTASVCPIK
jgi:hypothetical protein